MLKNIPKILSPEMLKVLSEMGHGDRLVIADGNFPSESVGKNAIVLRADGHGGAEMLDAILTLLPLDKNAECSANVMQVSPGDNVETPIWDEYKKIIAKYDEDAAKNIGEMERYAFYDAAKTSYLIIATGESALYANIMLQKGVI